MVPSRIEWSFYKDQELLGDGSVETLQEIAEQLPPGKVIYLVKTVLLVPAEWVTLTTADIPSQQAKHILKALPFALEEQLAEEIEDLHFALGERKKGQPIPVAAVSRSKMEDWIERCGEADIYPDFIVPDSLALNANHETHLALMLDGGRALLRLDKHRGLAVPDSQLAIVLDSILNQASDQDSDNAEDETAHEGEEGEGLSNNILLDLFVGNNQPDGGLSLDVLQSDLTSGEFGQAVDCETISIPGTVTSELARHLIDNHYEKHAINLLQGSFKVTKKQSGITLRWQPLAATVAFFIVVQLGMMIGQASYYEAQADLKNEEAVQLFKKWFPQTRRIVDIRRQLREKISGSADTGGDQFLYLISQSGEQIFALNRSAKNTVELDRVIYDEGQQNLRVDMRLTGFSELDKLKGNLEAKGLTVQIDQAVQDKDKIKARLRIKV